MAQSSISDPKSFENQLTSTARTAFFNPHKDKREAAQEDLRDAAPIANRDWARLDLAAGIKRRDIPDDTLQELVADSSLQVDSWEEFSPDTLTEQFVQSTVVEQLLGAGFGVNASLTRYMYTTSLQNVHLEADVDMNARARSRQDMPAHSLDGVPLPIVHTDYEIDAREYENAQAHGESFDTSMGTEARRANNRREARMLWDGWGGNVETSRGQYTVSGLDSDAPEIIQAANSTGWIGDAAGILGDFDALHDEIEGQTDVEDTDDIPLVSEVGARVFVPRTLWGEVTRTDYESAATDEPLIDRIERKYPYLNITPAPRLDGNTAILMLDDQRYFQIVNAQSPTNTSWEVDGGHGLRNKLVSSRVPFLRRQPDNIRGIVRMTGINQ